MMYNSLLKEFFSVKNKENHKILTFLGIRFKFRKRSLSSSNAVLLEEIIRNIISNMNIYLLGIIR